MTSRRHGHLPFLLAMLCALAVSAAVHATGPPCSPCAGLAVSDPTGWAAAIAAEPRLAPEDRMYVAWHVPATEARSAVAEADAVAEAGAVPWVALEFQVASPVRDHVAILEAELDEVAAAAARFPIGTHIQILWAPAADHPLDYAFLLKRAAVAVSGATEVPTVITTPLPADLEFLTTLYGEEIAAYTDGIALILPGQEMSEVRDVVGALETLDPGKPVAVGIPTLERGISGLLADAADAAEHGIALTFFGAGAPDASIVAAIKVLAHEFHGDMAFDPYSAPTGSGRTWSFVRGEDLGLRVISVAADDDPRELAFSDSTLRRPERIDLVDGTATEIFGLRNTDQGISVPLESPARAVVMRFSRPDIADLVGEGGLAEELTVFTERTMPVEEILRRLQANEDSQSRRIHHYEAINTTHLRLGTGTGSESIETTFRGPLWKVRGESPDWAWKEFLINGVRWRRERIPEIPLLQPEKAATLPLEITFGKEYDYRLRGTGDAEGRDCWVVDFEPRASSKGENLWQGTVWVDRQTYRRVRSRAVQLGLAGDVISNEETMFYSPIDDAGAPVEWAPDATALPLRVVSQQLFSILAGTTQVEKETLISDVTLNREGFEERRQAVFESEATIVRDTDAGLRYLILDKETGERVVQEDFDSDRFLGLGGLFVDDSLDYPLPLGGVNWVSFDLKGSGTQANVFFAGVLVSASVGDPTFLGSRFDASADLFFLGIPFSNTLFRDNVEAFREGVRIRPASLGFKVGHPLGKFAKLSLDLGVAQSDFSSGKNAAEDFVVPQDHFTLSYGLDFRYNRKGWRLRLGGSRYERSDWEFWGLPDAEFDPSTESYTRWRASLNKNFHFTKFRRFGLGLDYVGGDNLDRFSKYNFGYFSNIRVHGYQTGRVRGEEAYALHASYGLGIGDAFRIDLVGDAAWATDMESGLDNELLGGTGLVGQFVGPWQTLIQMDVGVPVAGPDDGFTAFIAILRLFK